MAHSIKYAHLGHHFRPNPTDSGKKEGQGEYICNLTSFTPIGDPHIIEYLAYVLSLLI